MANKQFSGKIFDGTKDEKYREKFNQYVRELPSKDSLFNCSNLRVLPQDVKLINKGYPSETYKQGSLICLYAIPIELNPVCNISSDLKSDNEGGLEFTCDRADVSTGKQESRLRTFKVNLINFEEK